ncbi:YfhO family protein, partial [Patescibacteria group bacterium]|nr:YfhO family protein [Patescibacteria group bacterium]
MKKEIILIALVFFCVVAIFFYPVFKGDMPFPGDLLVGTNPYNSRGFNGFAAGGVPNKSQGTDVIRELYPWKHFAIEMFKKGQIAFWNPYDFSGNPLMANFQSGAFYPLNLIFFALPFNGGWTLFIFLAPFLSALFTYLYLREIKIGKVASIFSGIVFAFSSYMVVWMEYGNIGHTFLWLPLGLFLTEKLINDFKRKYLFFLIALFFTASLAGYIQGYSYIIITLLYYYFVKSIYSKQILTRKTVLYCIAILIPALLTSFQLFPTLELFQHSSRGNYSLEAIEKLLNPWWYMITVIAPDFFGNPASRNHFFYGTYIERVSYFGVIPFILALSALFQFRKRKEIAIFGVVFIVSLLLAYDILFTKFLYLIPVPVISTTVPTRVLSLFVLSGSILAGFGLEILLKEGRRKPVFLTSGFAVLLLSIGWITALFNNMTVSQRNLIIPSFFVLLFLILSWFYLFSLLSFPRRRESIKRLFIIVLFAITLFDLFRFFHKITPFSPTEYVYPATPVISYIQKNAGINRYWGYGSGHIETNIQLYDHTFLPDGHDALHARSYAEFIASSKDGKIPLVLSRSDSEIAPGFGPDDFRNNYYRQKILNLLGVKYIVMKNEEVSDNAAYKLVWKETPWQIYENLDSAPRAFLTSDIKIITNKKDITPAFYDKSFDEKKTVILEENPGLLASNLKIKKVKLLNYEPNKINLTTSSDGTALLFLSDTYYPGWKAAIDGEDTKIYVANYAFRAVKVPQGEHRVEFYYSPESFKTGLILSAAALAGLMGFILSTRRKR